MITLKDALTASGNYPQRENHKEATAEVKANLEKLLVQVNKLLYNLDIENAEVSSGFRPSEVNKGIPNAAKKSLHMTGQAIDIKDPNNTLSNLVKTIEETSPGFLKSYGLWLEHPDATPGWCHLDSSSSRKDRPIRIFKP